MQQNVPLDDVNTKEYVDILQLKGCAVALIVMYLDTRFISIAILSFYSFIYVLITLNQVAKIDKWEPIFAVDSLVAFNHVERDFSDYNIQSLLNHGFSNQGPGLAVGDINADGLQDVFVGGSYGFASTIFVQQKSGGFEKNEIPDSQLYEDLGALFFDANGDGLQD